MTHPYIAKYTKMPPLLITPKLWCSQRKCHPADSTMSSFDSASSQAALNEALWSPPQDVRAGGVHPTPRRQSVRGVDAHKPRGSSARTGTIRSSAPRNQTHENGTQR